MNQRFHKILHPETIFIIVLLAVSLFYNLQEYILERPHSLHVWRQTDCGSIALNYYQDGMDFFSPELHHQNADGYTSGHNISEFPVIYYFVAALYHVFGPHEIIFRLVNMVLFFIGLLYLFKFFKKILKDVFWSIVLTLTVYTGSLIIYYSISFLPNTSALAFVFIGLFHFYNYYESPRNKDFVYAFSFFTLAALLKITAAILPIAIIGLFLTEKLLKLKFKREQGIFGNSYYPLGVFVAFLALVFAWNYYVFLFNKMHSTSYFGTHVWPIWEMNASGIPEHIPSIKRWVREMINLELQYVYALFLALVIWFYRYLPRMVTTLTVFVLIGVTLYIILWYQVLNAHDYYFINLMILPVLFLAMVFLTLFRKFPLLLKSKYLKIAIAILFFFVINNTKSKQKGRQAGWYEPYAKYENLYEISDYLNTIGVHKDDRVVSIPDNTPGVSLYLMNRKGWTLRQYPRDAMVTKVLKRNPKYLIVNGEQYIQKTYFNKISKEKVGEKNGVVIYRIIE